MRDTEADLDAAQKPNKATDIQTKKSSGDVVLQEIWRI
jgi:hypothetical protein